MPKSLKVPIIYLVYAGSKTTLPMQWNWFTATRCDRLLAAWAADKINPMITKAISKIAINLLANPLLCGDDFRNFRAA